MVYENEIIMLVLGLGVLVFVLLNYVHLKRIPWFGILLTAFCLLVAGWVMTVLEGFFPEGLFWNSSVNFLEHLFYAVSGIVASVWCWGSLGKAKEGR
jgi:hypothetical protein